MQEEIWKPIADIEGYEVSNLGRVRSLKRKQPHIMKPHIPALHRWDYLGVRLCVQGKMIYRSIHRLVAQAFIPNPKNKPIVNHINGIKTDNRAENLEWCTLSENTIHAYNTGLKTALRGETNPSSKLTAEQVEYIRKNPSGLTQIQLAKRLGVSQSTVSAIQLGYNWKNEGGLVREPKFPRVHETVRAEIKQLYLKGSREFSARALAKRFGVCHSTILDIVSGG